MKTKFLNVINENSMILPGHKVIVGLSGGADSMCLISLFVETMDQLGISVEAAHINHAIRGQEADDDEYFVKRFCSEHDIPLHCIKYNIPEIAKLNGESIELCARKKRYEFFESLNADVIATAHTGSDRIETMLMNLSRGTSLTGLCSIPVKRGNIIRPLIDFTRSEIEEYCQTNNIPFVTDSSNLTDEYTRNKYRHNIVSSFKSINPSFEKNVLRCLKTINYDDEYFENEVNSLFVEKINTDLSLNIMNMENKPYSILSRLVIKFLEKNSVFEYETKHIEFILRNISSEFSVVLPDGIRISGDKNRIFRDDIKVLKKELLIYNFAKNEEKIFDFCGKRIIIYNSFNLPDNKNESIYVVDYNKVSENLTLRTRLAGDIIYLGKRKCSKTLKKLFNEMKIPQEQRDKLFVFADDNGIVCVENVGVDSNRYISSTTERFLIIKTEDNKNE